MAGRAAPSRPVRRGLSRLSTGTRTGRGRRERRLRPRPRRDLAGAHAAHLRRALDPGVGVRQQSADGLLELAVRQRADHGHCGGARLPVPAPQPQLLLRAQHVRDRDVHRADRLRRVPDGASAVHARMGLHRLRLRRHRRASRNSSRGRRLDHRAHQPLRRRPLDARLLRPDDRLAARPPGTPADRQGRVVPLSVPDGVRDHRHRQPLHLRRDPRSAHRRPRRLRRALARTRARRGVWRFSGAASHPPTGEADGPATSGSDRAARGGEHPGRGRTAEPRSEPASGASSCATV